MDTCYAININGNLFSTYSDWCQHSQLIVKCSSFRNVARLKCYLNCEKKYDLRDKRYDLRDKRYDLRDKRYKHQQIRAQPERCLILAIFKLSDAETML